MLQPQIRSFRMSNGNCAVFTQKKDSHGLSHNIAAADNHAFPACDFNAGSFEQLDNPCRGTGYKPRLAYA